MKTHPNRARTFKPTQIHSEGFSVQKARSARDKVGLKLLGMLAALLMTFLKS
jgi:hypothetical protein